MLYLFILLWSIEIFMFLIHKLLFEVLRPPSCWYYIFVRCNKCTYLTRYNIINVKYDIMKVGENHRCSKRNIV